jgi:serine/threonine protein kinase
MHRKLVLHRDLKAENIRLTRPTKEWVDNLERLHVKIIDFGLSCRLRDEPETGWLGTPGELHRMHVSCAACVCHAHVAYQGQLLLHQLSAHCSCKDPLPARM